MPCTVQRSMNLLNEHFVERIQHSAGSVAGVPQMAVFIMYILQRRKLTWGGVPRCVLFGFKLHGFYHSLFRMVARAAGVILTSIRAPTDKGISLKYNTPKKTDPQTFMGESGFQQNQEGPNSKANKLITHTEGGCSPLFS